MKKPLIILAGPTASGKTSLSIKLAQRIGGEIISADSMQVYKEMDIGSAKVTPEEMQGIPHYLIDELQPAEDFNVVKFQELAKKYMNIIYAKGKIPIIAGGTGFYIQALLYDIDFTENPEDETYRKELERLAAEKGGSYLHKLLEQCDETSAASIHPNNLKRVIRALEFYHQTGIKISEHNAKEAAKESPYDYLYFVLNDDRAQLYEKIDRRVDQMLASGLEEEVRKLQTAGCTRDMVSMQGLGYKEMLAYLDGEYSLDEAIRILKRDTRHFAKRQLTWFKREKSVHWIDRQHFKDEAEMTDEMLRIYTSHFRKGHQ